MKFKIQIPARNVKLDWEVKKRLKKVANAKFWLRTSKDININQRNKRPTNEHEKKPAIIDF
jgi:hypothetical protein